MSMTMSMSSTGTATAPMSTGTSMDMDMDMGGMGHDMGGSCQISVSLTFHTFRPCILLPDTTKDKMIRDHIPSLSILTNLL